MNLSVWNKKIFMGGRWRTDAAVGEQRHTDTAVGGQRCIDAAWNPARVLCWSSKELECLEQEDIHLTLVLQSITQTILLKTLFFYY
jgi:hypothetical protein